MRKGERIRETWIEAIGGSSKYLFWAKGEVFRELFGALVIAKVRKYRTEIAATGRKSPTDAVGGIPVSRLLKS